ncbi:hypothetical protein DEU56DRAFT_757138 [Suillus clintonianus]|uniref:uncharacterized protein n=1 Tax=Suillus clintonianus TaxID=1904413 RepID=UPI001B885482|nr:uncharacterized protein DEU56DRAFT_757138 [Suillus clintonianus]KAG2133311.1 hypothetical protein DEU56DRAFT_757138 [Suillus clintonianus]
MNEFNIPPRKKRLPGWLKKSRSDPHLSEERGGRRAADDTSPLPPSRNGSRGRSPGKVSKFLAKLPNPFHRSARQSPNPETTAGSSSAQTQDPSSLITPTPEPNIEQSSNSGMAEVDHLDPKIVNERITSATKGLVGIGLVPTIIQNASSAPDNSQHLSDVVDTLSPLLQPLKVFNAVANVIADVQTTISVLYIPTRRRH